MMMSFREFIPNCNQSIDAARVGQSKVHESNIRLVVSNHLNGFGQPVAAWATRIMSGWLLMMAAMPSRSKG